MIERIGLVAWRELVATLRTRSFVMLVLAPIISVVVLPLVLLPMLWLGQLLADGQQAAEKPVVELVDPTGVLGERLQLALEGQWEVTTVAAEADRDALLEQEVSLRVVIDADAVAGGAFGVLLPGPENRKELRAVEPVLEAVERGLLEVRLGAAGLDEAAVREVLTVERRLEYVAPPQRSFLALWQEVRSRVVPTLVLALMLVALLLAGQGLLTSTLEEKTTRVAEVLLGAVSPVELLTGKVLGQLGVSLLFALLWGAPAWVGMALFGAVLVGPVQALVLVLLLGAASLSWAAVMGGVGSAMNSVTEAQHVLGPLSLLMLLLFVPGVAAILVPDSPVVVACSLLPPTAGPTMAARLVSEVPPPWWHVVLGVLSAWLTALGMLWLGGRLFRVGLLLRGSPPNLRTLARWVVTGA